MEATPSTGQAESKGERTRRRILDAARRAFGDVGYERATIRAIADAADVDPAAVIQYFGSKEQLFCEAIDLRPEMLPNVRADDAEATAEALLRFSLSQWRGDAGETMTALSRASFTSEVAAEQLREVLTTRTAWLADAIGGRDARPRAAMFAAFMFGITAHRTLLKVTDIAAADEEDILRLAVPVLASLLTDEPTRD
jgi:AcrR family transcriptional regulator